MTAQPFLKPLATAFPAIAGALVSVMFLPRGLDTKKIVLSLICAALIAHFGGTALAVYFGLTQEEIKSGVIFTTGMFGLVISSHVATALPRILAGAINKFTGVKSD